MRRIQNTSPTPPKKGAKEVELSCQAGHQGHDLIIVQANQCK